MSETLNRRRTIGEAIAEAVVTRDIAAADRISDVLRAKGFNYQDTFKFVRDCCARRGVEVTIEEWEALLYEASNEL